MRLNDRLNDRVTALVRAELDRTGLTITAGARVLGHENNWLSQKLAGKRGWSLTDLEAIAARMPGVHLEQLFTRAEPAAEAPSYDVPLPLEQSA